ncbi:MAG: restriction endonuclease [Candidatus Hodarchaeales archaeon]
MSSELEAKNLQDLALIAFESRGMICLHPMQIFKHVLADSHLTYVIKNVGQDVSGYTGVILCDWKRVVGISQIEKAIKVLSVCQPKLQKTIIVSTMGFSYPAKKLAKKSGIGLLTRRELISLIPSHIEIS